MSRSSSTVDRFWRRLRFARFGLLAGMILVASDVGRQAQAATLTNRLDRLEWFRDQGFGLFIHWSMDSQLGSVISHSMVAADEPYLRRFVEDLPQTFNPHRFEPNDWAALAKLAGIRYVVFTTKHHSGFCMWDTKTTDFNVMNTPFKRDVTREIVDAFRGQGIAAGHYFSPDDFLWLWKNHVELQRHIDAIQPRNNPGLMDLNLEQVRELMTDYGTIDVLFFDGEAQRLRDLAWRLQPNVVVTRGAIETPEQYVPGLPLEGAWEANMTMGTQWHYKPTNENYKSAWDCISLLIESRAKGGNFLLNVGPKPNGELPIEQEERLREIALWMFLNGECIHSVRPWVITNEQEIWFTKKKGEATLYAVVKRPPEKRWRYGQWQEFVLRSVKSTDKTQISILGQNDKVLEYSPNVTPRTTWSQKPDGLHIRAMRAQRIYNDRKWPNPVVMKLTHVEPALVPPRVQTIGARWDGSREVIVLEGMLHGLGDADSLMVGFEVRDSTHMDLTEKLGGWETGPTRTLTQPGKFSAVLADAKSGHTYDIRAVVKHPLLTLFGAERTVRAP